LPISKKCCIFAVAIPRRGCLHVIGWGSRHIKRRLLTLCSDVFETSQLSKASSGLSNDRCPTGYRLSLLCQFWLSSAHTYLYAHAITLSIYGTRVYLYSAWASALSVQRCRQCEGLENVERQQSDSTLFLYA
jgi:hypothetical protein